MLRKPKISVDLRFNAQHSKRKQAQHSQVKQDSKASIKITYIDSEGPYDFTCGANLRGPNY